MSEGFVRLVPDDVPIEHGALADALAVGWYHTRLGVEDAPARGAVPLVLGLGAIGLSVVMALRERGSGPIVGADFAPSCRAPAAELGADAVDDPAPLVGERVSLEGLADAIDRARRPDAPVRIIYVADPA